MPWTLWLSAWTTYDLVIVWLTWTVYSSPCDWHRTVYSSLCDWHRTVYSRHCLIDTGQSTARRTGLPFTFYTFSNTNTNTNTNTELLLFCVEPTEFMSDFCAKKLELLVSNFITVHRTLDWAGIAQSVWRLNTGWTTEAPEFESR
jgi:hypothetical protein